MTPTSIAFERVSGEARRFYRLFVEPARQLPLFADGEPELALIAVYGRIDSWTQRCTWTFASHGALAKKWRALVQRRRAHGYVELHASH